MTQNLRVKGKGESNQHRDPKVSVVVSHMNSARTIRNCLRRILSQEYPQGALEVIVVDGGSTDGSDGIVDGLDSPIVHQYIIPGCSEANGQDFGIKRALGDVVILTNSDIYVPEGWITKHVDWLAKGFDLVGGSVFWGGDRFSLTWNMPRVNGPRRVAVSGMGWGFSNCSFRREFYGRIGGIRDYKSQHDTEFVLRAAKGGAKMILDPSLEIYHDHPFRSVKDSFNRAFGYARNHLLVLRSTYGKVVSGSGTPVTFSLRTLLEETTQVSAVKVYRQRITAARRHGIDVSLPRFVVTRFFGMRLGQMLGWLVGAFDRNASFDKIADLHYSRFTSQTLIPPRVATPPDQRRTTRGKEQ